MTFGRNCETAIQMDKMPIARPKTETSPPSVNFIVAARLTNTWAVLKQVIVLFRGRYWQGS